MTVWDPEHGEIQSELHLPVPMTSFNTLPDVTPIVQQYNDVVDHYVPSKDTVQYFYDNVSIINRNFSLKSFWNRVGIFL